MYTTERRGGGGDIKDVHNGRMGMTQKTCTTEKAEVVGGGGM